MDTHHNSPVSPLEQHLRDEAIAHQVRAILAGLRWEQTCSMDVSVQGGVVTLGGTCSDDRAHDAIKQALMQIHAVRGVEDRLDWIVPDCGVGVALRH